MTSLQVGHVAQLFLHPLKAGRAVDVEWAQLGPRGPRAGLIRDRGFMVARPDGRAVDGRGGFPRLALVELTSAGPATWRLAGGEECCSSAMSYLSSRHGGLCVP